MARISLLFSLALVLAIGSVFAHPPTHKKTHKTLCPPTLEKLQAFPYTEISKFVEKQAQFAPNNVQFKILFATCQGYTNFLGGFKFSGSKEALFHSIHAKFALMARTLLATQKHIGVEGVLGDKLSNSYLTMAKRYVGLVQKLAEISDKYQFNANAKISLSDRAVIEKAVIKLKGSIRVYVKVITLCTKKFSVGKNIGLIGSFAKNSLGYADKLIRFGASGQVGAGVGAGVEVGAKAKAGVHAGAKGKVGAHAKAKVGAHAKGKVGAHAKGKVGGQGEAKVGGKIGGVFGGFLGFGGKAQFDAAGKANVGGGSGFRPLSNTHKKHLD